MTSERDPELGKALDLALPSPNAPYGAKLRVRRRLDERLRAARPSAKTAALALLATAACAFALFLGFGAATTPTPTAPGHSVLMLSSARVVLRDDAMLSVERDDAAGAVLRLTAGAALFHVQKGTGKRFEVVAGATRVSVVGTVFGVALGPRGAAVEVVEGSVDVRDASGRRRLRAGEVWPAGHRLFGAAELELVAAPLPKTAANSAVAPSLLPPLAPESPVGTVETPSAEVGAPLGSAHKPPSASAPSSTPESAYSRARSFERAGDVVGAVAAYQAIVDSGGENLEDALFALARLRAHGGDQSGALALAARYRGEFTTGRYARDNDVLVLNAELARGNGAAALRESEAFLERFPNDPRAWRFRLVRAADRARRGDCAGARSDVETAPDGDAKRSVLERCPDEHR